MKNEKTWSMANRFSSKCLIVVSVGTILFYLAANYFLDGADMAIILSLSFYVVNLLMLIPFTEIFLKMIFDKNGQINLK